MKFLEKLSLKLFSLIILVLCVIILLIIAAVLKPDFLTIQIQKMLANEIITNVTIGVTVVLILLALKSLLFAQDTSKEGADGILLENANGKLLISRESLENIVNGVTRNFEGIENVFSKIVLDKEKNLKVFVTVDINQNVVIKELSNSIQDKVKETIKKYIDIEVKEVNIKIKNINTKKYNKNLAKETKVEKEISKEEPIVEEKSNEENNE